jgi:hypothetical protein
LIQTLILPMKTLRMHWMPMRTCLLSHHIRIA